jgi:hypothetical protein
MHPHVLDAGHPQLFAASPDYAVNYPHVGTGNATIVGNNTVKRHTGMPAAGLSKGIVICWKAGAEQVADGLVVLRSHVVFVNGLYFHHILVWYAINVRGERGFVNFILIFNRSMVFYYYNQKL